GCGLFYGDSSYQGGVLTPNYPECDWHMTWPGELEAFHPDVVALLVGAWDVPDREIDGQRVNFGTVDFDKAFLQRLDEASTMLTSTGARLVVLTTPYFSRTEVVGQPGRSWPEYQPWRVDRLNSLFREFLENHPGRYRLIDLNKFVSPGGHYTDTLDGVDLRVD